MKNAEITWELKDGREVRVDAVRYGTGYTARVRVEGKELGRGWVTRAEAPAHFRAYAKDVLAIVGDKVAVKDAVVVARVDALVEAAELGDTELQERNAKTDAAIEKEVNARIAYDEREADHNRKCEDDSGAAWS